MYRSLIIILAAFAGLSPTPVAYADEVSPMSADVLLAELRAPHPPVVLDVRSAEEFAEGHLPGAINIAYTDLEQNIDRLNDSQDIVVYCVTGIRAGKALKILQTHRFRHLWHLDGDYAGWVEAGHDIERQAPSTAH